MHKYGYQNYVCSCITSFGLYCETLESWREFPDLQNKIAENLMKATGLELAKPKFLGSCTCDLVYKYRNLIAAQAKFKLVDTETQASL
jgi:heterodisulfide reductase subunit B